MTGAEMLDWRNRLGLTQRQAAVWMGIERRQIGRYENDRAAIPRLVELACEAVEGRVSKARAHLKER